MNFVSSEPLLMDAKPARQPLFNIPPMTLIWLGVLTLIQLVRAFVLSPAQDAVWVEQLSFTPALFHVLAWHDPLVWLSLISYALLHFGWLHFATNVTGLMAFGSAVERQFGVWRYNLILLSGVVAGALLQFAVDPLGMETLGGISAGLSALFAVVLAILQQSRGTRRWRDLAKPVLLWLVLNYAVGALGLPQTSSAGAPSFLAIAWVAHVGGFVAGLLWLPILWPHYRFQKIGVTHD